MKRIEYIFYKYAMKDNRYGDNLAWFLEKPTEEKILAVIRVWYKNKITLDDITIIKVGKPKSYPLYNNETKNLYYYNQKCDGNIIAIHHDNLGYGYQIESLGHKGQFYREEKFKIKEAQNV